MPEKITSRATSGEAIHQRITLTLRYSPGRYARRNQAESPSLAQTFADYLRDWNYDDTSVEFAIEAEDIDEETFEAALRD